MFRIKHELLPSALEYLHALAFVPSIFLHKSEGVRMRFNDDMATWGIFLEELVNDAETEADIQNREALWLTFTERLCRVSHDVACKLPRTLPTAP